MFYTTEAIVLKKHKVSDSDVILTLFTRKQGKVRVYVNGARNPKSKLSAGAHPFIYGDYTVNTRKNLDNLTGIDIKESFYHIREDLTKLSYASYMIELTEKTISEGVSNNRLFDFLLKTLFMIMEYDGGYRLNKVAFELKLLHFMGFKPEMKVCINCGSDKNLLNAFSIEGGGVICTNCVYEIRNKLKISKEVIRLINFVLKNDYSTIFRADISDKILIEAEDFLEKFIKYHITKSEIKSLSFLKTLNI